jgi:hypothetical protein
MPLEQPVQKTQVPGSSITEPKTRGANRSTKVAGKLKVLPEQPEPVTARVDLPAPPKDHDENVGTTGDSDEADVDDDEEEPEDVEVSCRQCVLLHFLDMTTGLQPNIFNTRRNSQERCFETD